MHDVRNIQTSNNESSCLLCFCVQLFVGNLIIEIYNNFFRFYQETTGIRYWWYLVYLTCKFPRKLSCKQ